MSLTGHNYRRNLIRIEAPEPDRTAPPSDTATDFDLDYEKMSVKQLKYIADESEIEYAGNIKKADLIELIRAAGSA
jgi:hypothetical protein